VAVASKECTSSHCGFSEAISEAKLYHSDGHSFFFPNFDPCVLFLFPIIKLLWKAHLHKQTTGYELDTQNSIPKMEGILFHTSGATQSPILGDFFLGVNWPQYQADHSYSSKTTYKKEWSITFSAPIYKFRKLVLLFDHESLTFFLNLKIKTHKIIILITVTYEHKLSGVSHFAGRIQIESI
jgi:hypothetical protein